MPCCADDIESGEKMSSGTYDGSLRFDTKMDSKGFNQGTDSITQKMGKLVGSLKAVGVAIAGAFVTKAIKNCIDEAEKLQNAMTGLKSIMDGQGKSYSAAQRFIKSYTEDGLIPQTEAITAYKNLALRGYKTDQIEKVMTALKDSATYSRQSSYSLGEAVQSAAEGLKNENSILVDNAGVTKNVAKMWEDYAKSIGKTTNNLTQQEKIEAEVNGILEETKFQTGDSITYANSYSGMIARLSASFATLKQTLGGAFMQIFQAILPMIQIVINALIKLATIFAQFVSLIFGKQVDINNKVAKSSSAAAGGIKKQGDSAEKAGKKAEKAGKQAKGALLDFDKLTVLEDEANNSSSGSGSSADAGGIDTAGLEGLGNLELGSNIEISPKVKQAFEILKNIYEGFTKWVDKNFVPIFQEIGEQLKPKIENLKQIISTVFSDLSTLAGPLEDYFNNQFTPFLQQIVVNIGTNLNLMLDTFNLVFSSLWSNVIFPVFEKMITVIYPMMTEFYTQVLATLNELNIQVNKIFQKLYKEGIEPALTSIVSKWLEVYDIIKAKWDEIGKPTFEKIREYIKNLSDTLVNIWDTIIKPVWEEIMKNIDWLWQNHLKPLVDNFLDFVAEFVNGATEIYNKFILPLINWFVEKFGPSISNTLKTIVSIFYSVLGAVSDVINRSYNSTKRNNAIYHWSIYRRLAEKLGKVA